MKLKHLESALSSVTREFPNPQVHLEQYATSSHLAASVTLMALRNGDLGPGRSVLDLGCGTGMLALGAALVDSDFVLGLDMDDEALAVARSNVEELELQSVIQLIQAQVPYQPEDEHYNSHNFLSSSPDAASKKQQGTRGKRQNFRPTSVSRNRRGRQQRRCGGKSRYSDRIGTKDHYPVCDGPDSSSLQHYSNASDDDDGDDDESHNNQVLHSDSQITTPDSHFDQEHVVIDICRQIDFPLREKCVDTVLTNPPFGTKHNAGIDVQFLKVATRLARSTVYSFHKTSTRPFLLRTIQQWGFQPQVVAEMKFDLPNVYKFHRQGEVNIEVDLLRITLVQQQPGKLNATVERSDYGQSYSSQETNTKSEYDL